MRERRGDHQRQGAPSRQLLRWQDLTLALAVVVACVGFFAARYLSGALGGAARIYLDGEQILEIDLRPDDDYRVSLMEEYGVPVSLEVREGAIRFVDVACPDHICEKTGFISAEGQTATCMPNRVAAHIVAKS